ncbi:hypothetical protein BH11BAC7_BH11BAC7_06520 [soil metagenome]
MKSFTRLIFFLIIIPSLLSAQQPHDKIQTGAVNYKYLEHLTKLGIDSVRIAHGLTPLRNDSILYVAAKLHANYLDSTKTLTHFEKEYPAKYSPQDRVHFVGGLEFSVGENVLFDFVNTPTSGKHDAPGAQPRINETYQDMANAMVLDWVHSPPHFANMLTPGYEFTGLAVSFDPKKDCFYAVQVFGSLPYYKIPQPESVFFTYEPDTVSPISSFSQVSHESHSEKHAWQLSAPKDSVKTCAYCWNDNFSSASTKIEVVNGTIMFTTKDVELMKALLDNRTDGLAAEIVGYKPFDCGNPQYYQKASRRNDQCIFSGRILKPMYRKRLKRGFKKKDRHNLKERFKYASAKGKQALNKRDKRKAWFTEFVFPFTAETYSISLGKFPKNLDGQYYEVNVVIIQKNMVCRVVHFTSFCGEDWMITPVFAEPLTVSKDTLAFQSKFKSYSFKIPFEQGKYEYKQKDIQPFLDSLNLTNFKITKATINAFASVEGSEVLNKSLQNKRANSIVNAMTTSGEPFPAFISTAENWALFDKQVLTVPSFTRFKGKSHAEIKKMLEDTALSRQLEPWLSKQRYAAINLELEIFIYPGTDCKWLDTKVATWSDSLLKKKKRVFLDSLNCIQNFYYNTILSHTADTACIKQLMWPADKIFDTLAYNHAWILRYLSAADTTMIPDQIFYYACVSRVNNNKADPYWPCVFGMVNQYLAHWENTTFIDNSDPEIILKWIQWLKIGSPDSVIEIADSLELAWYYKSVPYYESKGKKYENQLAGSLFHIFKYWTAGRMNDSIALKLSNYLILHKQPDWGYATLKPWALKAEPNHLVLMQYIRLTYSHVEEDRDFDDYFNFISWAKTYLTHEEWCSMFVGPCNISFQVFDSEKMRNLYCEECSEWKNYAESPALWKVK